MGADGVYTSENGTWQLRFERELAHPVEKVWDALTSDERITDWLTDNGTIDLRVGGKVSLNDHEIESTIVDLDPPKVIEYGWDGKDWEGGTVRWELSPTSEGTKLVLLHRLQAQTPEQIETFMASHPDLPDGWEPRASTLAGWHSILDRLEAAIDGSPIPDNMEKWLALNDHYT